MMSQIAQENMRLLLWGRDLLTKALQNPSTSADNSPIVRQHIYLSVHRLQHITAWILAQKSAEEGSMSWEEARGPKFFLPVDGAEYEAPDFRVLQNLPKEVLDLVVETFALYEQVLQIQG